MDLRDGGGRAEDLEHRPLHVVAVREEVVAGRLGDAALPLDTCALGVEEWDGGETGRGRAFGLGFRPTNIIILWASRYSFPIFQRNMSWSPVGHRRPERDGERELALKIGARKIGDRRGEYLGACGRTGACQELR